MNDMAIWIARSAALGATVSQHCWNVAQWKYHTGGIRKMILVGCVKMDGMHVDEALRLVAAQAMHIPLDALLEDVGIPGRETILAT